MSNAVQVQLLDLWTGSSVGALDSSLLARFAAERDEEAFASLVRRHGSLVYGTCQRILGNRADADDAFQAVFFVLARRARSLNLDRSIAPWLHGVALRVAKRLRGRIIHRRLREMAAAKTVRTEPADSTHEFWSIIDEELALLSLPLRVAVLLCDLGGQSHSQAADSLGLAKGTITKRLMRAHEELAARLRRRGITLGVGASSTLIATEAAAAAPASLLIETSKSAIEFSTGPVSGSTAAQTLAEGIMRSMKFGAVRSWLFVGLFALMLAGGGYMLAGGPDEKPAAANAEPPKPDTAKPGNMWRETFTAEYESSLPVSVAFSADGKTLLSGDTKGDVMATRLPSDPPTSRWKTSISGSHATVAYSADEKYVFATTEHGVRILDATTGKEVARIDEQNSNPIALGVFPNKIDAKFPQLRIVFGNSRGYFVKTWADLGKPADSMGTLETSTAAKGARSTDAAAVPLAVDPKGRSAIMTGPIDAKTKQNVLWAYVCGDDSKDSPGNRVMVGHTATVVSAAWSKEGGTAVTGDADGRVIMWDAKTMKESSRVELGGRVLAVAISGDGTHSAACVRGKQGGEFHVWETAKPTNTVKPVHYQQGDYRSEPYASVAFSPDGKRLAGCVIDKKWLQLDPKTVLQSGQVHVWDFSAEPKGQLPPKHIYTKQLPKGSSSNFVVLDNYTILTAAAKEGAIDFRNIKNGEIQARIGLGKFTVGRMKLSSDRKWLALEQHPTEGNVSAESFEVGVYAWPPAHMSTIPSCSQMLDVGAGSKVVAVVREKKLELWHVATTKLLKSAPFKHARIDAAAFSPDGKVLAISDRNDLVLWAWEEGKHERINLGRSVGSLAFSPDGKFLTEGPSSRENIRIRGADTGKVVRELANDANRSMDVPRVVYAQNGRVLIGCDNNVFAKEIAVPHRISLWDTSTGALAHGLAIPEGLPKMIDVSPNGRYLIAAIDDGEAGMKLSGWRLDGESPTKENGPTPPASGPR